MKKRSNLIQLLPSDTKEDIIHKASLVKPSDIQLNWISHAYTAFVHFGMNTFTNQEWGNGQEDPKLFNPYDFDAYEMVSTFKEAGMQMVILTCKHHDGFCLWPSRYTTHSVKSSPYRNGQGDIVKEVAEACHQLNVGFGIYLSPWDRHEKTYGQGEAYNDFYIHQLEELLTQYAPIVDVWLDGACGEGKNGKKQIYDWPRIYKTVRTLAPHATISGVAPDVRWCGNEAGKCRASEWNVIPIPDCDEFIPEESDQTANAIVNHNIKPPYMCTNDDLGSIEKLMEHAKNSDYLFWYPAQVNVSIRPGWFYHEYEDLSVKSVETLLEMYLNSVGGNTQFLLNVPPMPNGKLHETDISRLKTLGHILKQTFKTNYALNYVTKISEGCYEIHLPQPQTIDLIEIRENINEGQRIEEAKVYNLDNNELISTVTTIGSARYIKISSQTLQHLKIIVTASRDIPQISQIGLYQMPLLLGEPQMTRQNDQIVMSTKTPAKIYYSINGGKEQLYVNPFNLDHGGKVEAWAKYSQESLEKGIVTSTQKTGHIFGVNQKNWRIIHTSGKEVQTANAILNDDKNDYVKVEGYQYEVVIDMNEIYQLKGFLYQPVEEGYDFNYNCSACQLSFSQDLNSWVDLDIIEFDNIFHLPKLMVNYFDQVYEARYLKFKVEKSLRDDFVTFANVNIIV